MKREREKHITRLHIILFFMFIILCLGIYFGVKFAFSNKDNKYKDLEKNLVIASKNYYKIHKKTIEDGYEEYIDIKVLKKENLIQDIYNCKGYVTITSERVYQDEYKLAHRAYITCGNYHTTNYSDAIYIEINE